MAVMYVHDPKTGEFVPVSGFGTDQINAAVNSALEEAKNSGYFKGDPGEPGKDYVLTEADKEEIAGMVNAPGGGGSSVGLDTTLTQSGKAADAKATGDAIDELKKAIANKAALSGNVLTFKNGDSDLFSVDLSSFAGSSASSIDWTEGY